MQKKGILQTVIIVAVSTIIMSMNVLAGEYYSDIESPEEAVLSENTVRGQCGENANYELDLTTGTLRIYGTGPMEDYGIYVDRVQTKAPWYVHASSIKTVHIEEGITTIGAWAFGVSPYGKEEAYANLNSVDIADTVTIIKNCAFSNCGGLKSVVLPDSVEEIGMQAFMSASVSEVQWGVGPINIGEDAFACTAFERLEFPSRVHIGRRAFSSCEKLKHVIISDECEVFWQAFGYCKVLERISFGKNCILHGDLFRNCPLLSEITIGEGSTGASDPHDSADFGAFQGCVSLKTIQLPNSWEFATGSYREQFYGCTQLTDIQFRPDNSKYQTIDKVVYSKDGSTLIYYPEGLINPEYEILSGTQTIGYHAFHNQQYLNYVEIPDTVTRIKGYAFAWSKLKSIIIPDEVAEIESGGFYCCEDLMQVVLSRNVTKLEMPGKSTMGVFVPCPQTILGEKGSYAETFAGINGVTFQERSMVQFDANGGECQSSYKAVLANEPYRTLPVPTRTGYSFEGWYTSQTGGSQVTRSTTVNFTGNQTLYAHWKANTYTVGFNANGGNCGTKSKSVTYGSTYGILPIPTRKGYTFAGWYTAISGGSQVAGNTNVLINANNTLFAHWIKNEETQKRNKLKTPAKQNNKRRVEKENISLESATGVTKADQYMVLGKTKVSKKKLVLKLKTSGVKIKTYKSSNKKVATVSKKGVVRLKKIGMTTITVTATVTATGKKISKKYTLKVNPDKTILESVQSKAMGKVVIKWKQNPSGDGYEIYRSLSRNFKEDVRTYKIQGSKEKISTITDLIPGAKYYIKVRSYKLVSGKPYYGAWSKVKTVKVR